MAKSSSSGALRAFIIIVVLAAGGYGAYYYFDHRADKGPEYTTVPIAKGELIQAVTATGILQPVLTTNVSSQISGIIQKLYVDYNTPVKKGQIMAELDPSSYEANLRQADAQLASAKASNELAKINAGRSKALLEQNLISQSDYDTANAALLQSNAQVQIQDAQVYNAKVNLARCTIYAPIDGLVTSRQVDVGNTVAASLSAPTLFVIANDLAKMQIDSSVSEADIGNVALDQDVNFSVDAYPNRQFRGKVFQIRNYPVTQQNVVVYDTMIAVDNSDLKLKPGMTANVSIIVAERQGGLRIPNSALRIRMPEEVTQQVKAKAQAAAATTTAAATVTTTTSGTLRQATREEMRQIMTDAGFTRGAGGGGGGGGGGGQGGGIPPEVRAKMDELAKARGLELPAFGGGGRNSRTAQGPNTVVSRTVYVLRDSKDPGALPETISAKFGITDGVYTEVVDGLKEGDPVVTSVTVPNAKPQQQAGNNPFGGGGQRGGGRF